MNRREDNAARGAVEATLSEPQGASRAEQSGPVPVPSANPEKGNAAEGVRPAASPPPHRVAGGRWRRRGGPEQRTTTTPTTI